jgi:WD40 repeat protein
MSPLPAAALALFLTLPLAAAPPSIQARLVRTIHGHAEVPKEVAFSPDGSVLATSSVDGTVKFWRVPDGKLLRVLRHPMGVTSVDFSRDGRWIASGSYDGRVRVWSVGDGKLARTLAGHDGTVWTVAFSPDGASVASGGEDRLVRVWRTRDGAQLHALRGHALNVWSVAFSPDGKQLLSGSFDRSVRLWDAARGTALRTLTGHEQAVVAVAFSPRGDLVASGGDDSTVRLWRARDGALLKTLTGSDHVYSLSFSGDGVWLASGGRERGAIVTLWKQLTGNRLKGEARPTVRLWRVSDGALQQAIAAHDDDVWSVAFSRDGRWLGTSSYDGTVRVWGVGTAGHVVPAARRP